MRDGLKAISLEIEKDHSRPMHFEANCDPFSSLVKNKQNIESEMKKKNYEKRNQVERQQGLTTNHCVDWRD